MLHTILPQALLAPGQTHAHTHLTSYLALHYSSLFKDRVFLRIAAAHSDAALETSTRHRRRIGGSQPSAASQKKIRSSTIQCRGGASTCRVRPSVSSLLIGGVCAPLWRTSRVVSPAFFGVLLALSFSLWQGDLCCSSCRCCCYPAASTLSSALFIIHHHHHHVCRRNRQRVRRALLPDVRLERGAAPGAVCAYCVLHCFAGCCLRMPRSLVWLLTLVYCGCSPPFSIQHTATHLHDDL